MKATPLPWKFQLGVAKLAHRYGLPKLEEIATAQFKKIVEAEEDIKSILDVLQILKHPAYEPFGAVKLTEVTGMLKEKHWLAVDPCAAFLEKDEAAMKKNVTSFSARWFKHCRKCGKGDMVEKMPIDARCYNTEMNVERCWARE